MGAHAPVQSFYAHRARRQGRGCAKTGSVAVLRRISADLRLDQPCPRRTARVLNCCIRQGLPGPRPVLQGPALPALPPKARVAVWLGQVPPCRGRSPPYPELAGRPTSRWVVPVGGGRSPWRSPRGRHPGLHSRAAWQVADGPTRRPAPRPPQHPAPSDCPRYYSCDRRPEIRAKYRGLRAGWK